MWCAELDGEAQTTYLYSWSIYVVRVYFRNVYGLVKHMRITSTFFFYYICGARVFVKCICPHLVFFIFSFSGYAFLF